MQTFLPYKIHTSDVYYSFCRSAEILDSKRLNKQILEVYQILRALKEPSIEKHHRGYYKEQRKLKAQKLRLSRCKGKRPVVRGYTNHTATRMWRGYTQALICYGIACCETYTRRTGGSHVYYTVFLKAQTTTDFELPSWVDNEDLYASHRSNLLKKDFEFYSKYGWTENSSMEYVWPV